MKLRLLAVGQRLPRWVEEGFRDYERRLPRHLRLRVEELAPGPRRGAGGARAVADEGHRMLRRLAAGERVVALDGAGAPWSSEELAARLQRWQLEGRDVCLLVGGADGLHRDCLDRAEDRWSLGPLTLPHALVRVLLAEQVYRAWTLLTGHPYHRG